MVSALIAIMNLGGSRKTWYRLVVAGLLSIHAGLLAYSASVHSPTFNEPAHLAAGVSYWQLHRFDDYKVDPPLSRLVAALPVLAAGCKTDWTVYYDRPRGRPEMDLGKAFIHANGERSIWLFTIARWACIPFSLIGGYIVFRWSRELYGTAAGILSLVLWCFGPNTLAHGSLITPDMAGTALGVAACYMFWQWLRRPTWRRTLLCGVMLGLAELAKTTLLVFYFIWPLMWLVYRLTEWRSMCARHWLREFGMLAIGAIISIYTLNFGYGFKGTFTPLGKYRFVSDSLGAERRSGHVPEAGGNRFEHTWLAAIPVPLPRNYVEGIDLQKLDFERPQMSYLNGAWRRHGWWYYYLEALALKVPLGTWLLLLLAGTRRLCWRSSGDWRIFRCLVRKMGLSPSGERTVGGDARTTNVPAALPLPFAGEGRGEGENRYPTSAPLTWRDEFALLFPALAILAFVSSQTGFSEHMRYVLPIFPFFFVWIGRVAIAFTNRQRIVRALAGAALAWSIASSLFIYPHSLSYFNEIAGGPNGGSKYLLGSNVDWGQDALFFKRWLAKHPEAKPFELIYFGPAHPSEYGIQYTAPDESTRINGAEKLPIPPGWYAISVNLLNGYPDANLGGAGNLAWTNSGARKAFGQIAPFDRAGYSILIYHLATALPQ